MKIRVFEAFAGYGSQSIALYLIINLHQTTTASVFVPILQGFISPS